MSWIATLRIRLRALFRGAVVRMEIEDELAYHVEMRTRDYVAAGLDPTTARRAALRRFGDLRRTRHACHDLYLVEPADSGDGWMRQMMQDLRWAIRSAAKRPGFAAVVSVTLGLGVGANSALFTVVDGVLLRPLPYVAPDELVLAFENDRLRGTTQEGFSGPDFFDVRERNAAFRDVVAFRTPSYTLTGEDNEPQRVRGTAASVNLLSTLGVAPLIGRPFVEEEDVPGGARVVILAYPLWASRFGADEAVLGRSITLDGVPYEVVGVMGPEFSFPSPNTELWLPLQIGPNSVSRGNHAFGVMGRLRSGVSLERANADLTAIAAALEQEYPDENLGRGMWAQTLYDAAVGSVRPALLILFGAVGLVLLIACVNVANLLFARATAREREVAIRVALGAGRRQLVRQFLTESLVLASLGGMVGLGLAVLGVRVLVALGPQNLPRAHNIGVDFRVLGFTAAAAVITGIIFGLLPALHASKPDLHAPLKEGGRAATAGRGKQRLRRGLVVTEVTLAVVLVTGAGLLLKSFWRLRQVDPGFNPTSVLSVGVQLPASRYPQEIRDWPRWSEIRAFQQVMIRRVAALPGVEGAALALNDPTAAGWTTRFTIEGRPAVAEGEKDEIRIRVISPDFPRVVGVAVLRGRGLNERDGRADAPPVVLANEAMAARYFPEEDPIGQRVVIWGRSREIVGVVKDVRFVGLDRTVPPAVYPTFSQMPFSGFSLLVRTGSDPLEIIPRIRGVVKAMDPDLALSNIATLDDLLAEMMAQPRFNTLLLVVFAGVALGLASVGMYGVMSYDVGQRTQEIGVRLSLGARRGDVVRDIVADGLRLTAIGLLLGIGGSLATARVLTSLLFGVEPFDFMTLGAVAVVSLAVAVLACFIPAMRASRIDPVQALRYE